jgi:bla regulator protein blaR1
VWETSLRAGLGNAAVAAVLAVVVGCVGPLLRRRPALRHGLWLLVLIKMVTPPVWVVPVSWLAAPGDARPGRVALHDEGGATPDETDLIADGELGVIEVVVEPAPSPEPAPRAADPPPATPPAAASSWWWTIAAWTWLDGTLLAFGIAVVRVARFRRLLGLGRPAPAGVVAQVEALAARLGLERLPEVWWMPGAVSPMLWAAGGRPLLVVPADLWKRLDDRQRITLLVHELAHLRRRDHWVRGLELLATGLYWWHPAVWWARRELREAEEQCCDAWVVWAFPDAARTYAETLLEAVDFLSGPAPAVPSLASGLGQAQHLKRRLTMILRGTTHRTLNRSGALAVLGLSALMLPLSPTWAQKADDKEVGIEFVAPEVKVDVKAPTATEAQRQRMKATIDALGEHFRDLKRGANLAPEEEELLKRVTDQLARMTLADDKTPSATEEQRQRMRAALDALGEQVLALERGAKGETEDEFRFADKLVRMTLKALPDRPEADEKDDDEDEKDKDKDKPKPRPKVSKEPMDEKLKAAKEQMDEKLKAVKEKLGEEAGRRREDQERAREAREEIEKLRKAEREARAAHEKALARLIEAQAKLMAPDGFRFSVRGPIPPAAPFAPKPPGPEPRRRTEEPTKTYRFTPGSPEVFVHKTPDQDRRIDALEKKLDELMDVVKGLKAERGEKGSKPEGRRGPQRSEKPDDGPDGQAGARRDGPRPSPARSPFNAALGVLH